MRIFFSLISLIFIFFFSCSKIQSSDRENWISLFNNKDLNDWTIKIADRALNDNYKNTFQVEDNILKVVYDSYDDFDDKYGHIYYKQPYSFYKLRFDYRFNGNQTPGGELWNNRNSGVMIHSQSAQSNTYSQHFPVSIEIQLLGGLGIKQRPTANLCTPGTAVVYKNQLDFTHCISSISKTYHGDQWVNVEAIVLGGESITHIVENDTVLKYEAPQIDDAFLSKSAEGKDWEIMGVSNKEKWINKKGEIITEGYIALQAESHPIDFKNIKLLNLCGCMDKKAKNYKSYYIKNDVKNCIY